MILSETIPIKVAYNADYYISKGYTIPTKENINKYDFKKTVDVKPEDALPGTHVKIKVKCDYCGKELETYFDYYYRNIANQGKYACCEKCCVDKRRNTSLKKYGVDIPMKNPEVAKRCAEATSPENMRRGREKAKQTWLKKYGVDNPAKSSEIYNKIKQTNIERYGGPNSHCSPEVVLKTENTMQERYGVSYYTQTKEYKELMKTPEMKEQRAKAKYNNGTIKTSKQQRTIFDFLSNDYMCELNYPIGPYSGDIVFINEKIDLEIDYKGHDLSVRLGDISRSEFIQKQVARDHYVQSKGYKRIRIISTNTDKIPDKKAILDMMQLAIEYLLNSNHHWIEFNIDDEKYYNAENMEGVTYNYGKLTYSALLK